MDSNTPQGNDLEYIGIRNVSGKFPNTENVIDLLNERFILI